MLSPEKIVSIANELHEMGWKTTERHIFQICSTLMDSLSVYEQDQIFLELYNIETNYKRTPVPLRTGA